MEQRAARDGSNLRRGRRARVRVGAALLCAGMLLACGKAPPGPQRPKRGPGIGPATSAADLQAEKAAEPSVWQITQEPTQPTAAADTVEAEQAAGDKDKAQRDYPSELLQRLGNPASCLSPRPGDGNARPMQINIFAQVMPSGALARTDVTAGDLSVSERACIAQRAGAVHLPGPIEGAPLGIQASLTLQPSAAKAGPLAAAPTPKADADDTAPRQAAEGSTFIEPSPAAPEVPAAPPVQIGGEGTTP